MLKKLTAATLATLTLATLAGCEVTTGPDSLTSSSVSASLTEPVTTTEPDPLPATQPAVLTGLPLAAEAVPGTRLAAVVVNNSAVARPQSGLSGAGVLCELPVEGGLTRFLAFYEDYAALPEVGPVRSSRDGFLQLAMPWQPLFVCYGTSQHHDWYAEAFEQEERILDNFDYPDITLRDDERLDAQAYENTAYTSGTRLADVVRTHGIDDVRDYHSTFFNFVGSDEMAYSPAGGAATTVQVPFSASYRTYMNYDATQSLYLMSQYNSQNDLTEATLDLNNQQQLAYSNVVVLFAEMPVYAGTNVLLDIQFGYGGVGYFFSYGRFERIRWTKDSPQHALQLYHIDDTATPLRVNTGATYLAVVDVEQAAEFAYGAGDTLVRLGEQPNAE